MKLVRFGDTTVNMDRLNYVEFKPTTAYLFFSGPYAPGGIESLQSDYVKLEGDNVEALRMWLAINSEDWSRDPAPAPAQAAEPAPGQEPDDF